MCADVVVHAGTGLPCVQANIANVSRAEKSQYIISVSLFPFWGQTFSIERAGSGDLSKSEAMMVCQSKWVIQELSE